MREGRRAAGAMLALVAALGLGACGGGDDADDAADGAVAAASSAGAAATSAAAAAGSAAESAVAAAGSAADGAAAAGDPAEGKEVFSSNCAGCHTLADAEAGGTVGPNLDDLKPDAALVTTTVTNGKGAMPPFGSQLSAEDVANVAAYVASVAGA